MKYEDYLAEEEARDPEFRAERNRLRPQYEFRRALIAARLAAGLTQKELAERLGTKQSAIARLEGGTTLPSLEMLYRLVDQLGAKMEITPQTGLTFRTIGRRNRRLRRDRHRPERTTSPASSERVQEPSISTR